MLARTHVPYQRMELHYTSVLPPAWQALSSSSHLQPSDAVPCCCLFLRMPLFCQVSARASWC